MLVFFLRIMFPFQVFFSVYTLYIFKIWLKAHCISLGWLLLFENFYKFVVTKKKTLPDL